MSTSFCMVCDFFSCSFDDKNVPPDINCSHRTKFFVPFWILCSAVLHETFIAQICPLWSFVQSCRHQHHQRLFLFCCFQGQYFSGGNFRIYLLGNPVIWWSNLAFLAAFLLMYFIAAIKQQRGYDADEKPETESKCNCVIVGEADLWPSLIIQDQISQR